MSDARYCPDCGFEIPAISPAALCPKCMLRAGWENHTVHAAENRSTSSLVGPAESSFIPPAELAGRFPQLEIVEFLGKGGMGAVYKARQRGLDRLVALKILPPDVNQDATFAERFTREARALARLNHPHIVAVHDFGQADGLYYLLMEYVEGANLRQTMRAGEMTPQEALAIVPQICEALQFAHDEGIIHRDIKPENILLDKRGRVKIADFGLAKLLGCGQADQTLTATHQVMGTPRYMAPEQMEGTRDVDHRADIYSLGVVFYEMLTGELPLGRFAPPSQKVRVDVRLDDVVLRTLEREPERRYQHASDVKTEVEGIQSQPLPPLARDNESRPPCALELTEKRLAQARYLIRAPAIGVITAGVLNCSLPILVSLGALIWFGTSRSTSPNNVTLTPTYISALPPDGEQFTARAALLIRGVIPPGFEPERLETWVTLTSRVLTEVNIESPIRHSVSVLREAIIFAYRASGDVILAEGSPFQSGSRPFSDAGIRLAILVLVPWLWTLAIGVATIIGGVSMLQMRSYGFAHVAAVLALLPCTPGCIVGLPCGLWALVALRQRDVKAAFERRWEQATPRS